MYQLNVAIIGMGFIGRLHYDALRRIPGVHIRTLVVHRAEDVPAARESYDADIVTDSWQEAVADPEIQVIHNCTPNILHDPINEAAIAAGKHIYAEKPMSLTTEGAIQVWKKAEAAVSGLNESGAEHFFTKKNYFSVTFLPPKEISPLIFCWMPPPPSKTVRKKLLPRDI